MSHPTIHTMTMNGDLRRAAACVLLCLSLGALSACTQSKPDPPPSSAQPTLSTSASTAKTITGTAYYLESKNNTLVVHTVHSGTDTTVTIAADAGPCPFNSAVISPDGSQIAWVSTADSNGHGTLMVSDLAGTHRRTLPSDVRCVGSRSLIWRDPSRISVTPAADIRQRVLLDAATGKSVGNEDQVSAWSEDGAWLAATDGNGGPIVMPKGSPGTARKYTYTPPADEAEHYDGWSARSVSVDGRYVSVGWNATDPSRNLGSFAVVDTVASKVVTLPVTGAVSSVHFQADGTVLVRLASGQLVLLDQHFTVLERATEPAAVHNLLLLKYLP
jgi:hypothetical protein